ncbi:MAG TPA: hypothetical protein VKF62_11080, partial [Planctomycetota bacterium]|nr:hypothetical protein [Planctomycetota bacterium]
GWYVIGVEAWDARGRPFFPAASPLVFLDAGEYDFTFRIVPTSTLEGRVLAENETSSLAVGLFDGGRAVPLRSTAMPFSDSLEVGASGAFRLLHVPVGGFSLRVGTPKEIREGGFRREVPVEIREGENLPVEIRL